MSRKITHIDLFIAAVKSLGIGLGLTLKHFAQAIGVKRRAQVGVMHPAYFTQSDKGIVTNLYPYESIPVPDNGRYRLHNEIEDCIVCDLCAKVCPVNCIDIEPIKSPVEISKTSDGSTKRIYAAKFDIDMAKCCYCGLCTTVCPTECLTMTKTYDFSEYNVSNMVYHFAEMSPAQAVVKKEEMEVLTAEEKAKKAAPKETTAITEGEGTDAAPKPVFKPKATIPGIKKPVSTESAETTSSEEPLPSSNIISEGTPAAPKPVFKPKVMIPAPKPVSDIPAENTESKDIVSNQPSSADATAESKPSIPKPVFKPKPVIPAVKKPTTEASDITPAPIDPTSASEIKSVSDESTQEAIAPKPKPVMKPIMKPVIPKKKEDEEGGDQV